MKKRFDLMRFANTIFKLKLAGRFGMNKLENRSGNDTFTMKLTSSFAARCGLILISLGSAGCQTHTTVVPLRNGYEEVAHSQHALTDEPEPPRISLQYRGADGIVTPIWPSLYGVNDVINGDVAIFVAEKASLDPERVTHPRLFAVRSPALPLDITEEVLWRWSQANGKDFSTTLQKLALVTPEDKHGGLELRLEFWASDTWSAQREDWPEQGTLQLEWGQVKEIMHTVKTKGVLQKDLRWKTAYIGEKL